ncbi:hypothetical protein DNTS_002697 [Danionella cerebrum]|uniref:Histone-lysine N-methyltransferase n=1 Tax=Danionella cerebrum TaxID=2873325 RepID=A0A553RG00_9TELE|nr:hypothetical protein DNTS_002697 [Danionella translucida]
MTDSKGRSLPAMPEPKSPTTMKQLSDSPGGRKGLVDGITDPVVDKAVTQLATTPQESVLQMIGSHGHNHTHERLKDLTSRLLNGDQDAIPKLCVATAAQPPLKGMEPLPQHASPQRKSPENGFKVTDCVENLGGKMGLSGPDYLGERTDVTSAPLVESEGGIVSAKSRGERRKRAVVRKRVPLNHRRPLLESTTNSDQSPLLHMPTNSRDHCGPVEQNASVATFPEQETTCEETNDSRSVEVIDEAQEADDLKIMLQQFSPGDIFWTKMSGYPWWPCMITTDPEVNRHFKSKENGRTGFLYYVQYFGDVPERGYAFEKNMVPFSGKHQFQSLNCNKQRPSNSSGRKQSFPRKFRQQWEMAVLQGTEARGLPTEERLAKFSFVYEDGKAQLSPHVAQGRHGSQEIKEPTEPQELLSLTPPDSTHSSPVSAACVPDLLSHPTDSSTLPGKSSRPRKAQKPAVKANHSKQPSTSVKRRKVDLNPAQQTRLSESQDPSGTSEQKKTKATSGKRVYWRKVSFGPDVLPTDSELQPKAPQRNWRQIRQKFPAAPNPVKQRKVKAGVSICDALSAAATDLEPEGEGSPTKVMRSKKRKPESASQPFTSAKKSRQSYPELERPGSPSDSTDESHPLKKTERASGAKKESVCLVCEQSGEDLVMCEGKCWSSYHLQCIGLKTPAEKILCASCSSGVHVCFTCKKSDGVVQRCGVLYCGRFYHEACVRLSELTVFENRSFRCPLHTCLSCHYSVPATGKATRGKMMRCLRCPVAYHAGDLCVAAGSEVISSSAIVCTNHFRAKRGYSHHSHLNVSWCFICSKGGRLLCCESCPAAFHPDCLNITMPDGSWFCNDCRSGKKPKYRDIIWVKLGRYRWWPAEIRHPKNVPTNIQHLRHQIGEFPVFFFGSKDYFWTHQGRVFPYMEGDRGSKYQQSAIGKLFKNAVLDAEARFKEMEKEREAKQAQETKKPPPFKFIKVNRPCGRVQVYTADVSEIPKCNCKPSDKRPCSFESECLNRMLLYQCHPQVCPAGNRCQNQDFTKRLYPETKIIRTAGKGWGLVALRDIKKGEFVNEYIGELIDEEECRARIRHAQENDITHFYMLTIDKDRIIDAGPKGNYSRFMNHSCQPNCETQKWTVNGDTRVGLFAVCDIPAGTELTFNYNLDCLGNEKTVCRCGAPNCSGFLGDRPKNGHATEHKAKVQKKKPKRKRARNEGKKSEDECFRCGDGGKLVLCTKKDCTKAYHLSCLDRTKRPFGRWDCPWHHCDECGKNSVAFCQLCPNSFCKAHQEGALRSHPLTGKLCCQEHEDSEIQTQAQTTAATSSSKERKNSRKADAKSAGKAPLKKRPRKNAQV